MIPYTLTDFDSRNRWNECCKRYHIKGVVCTMQVGLIPTVLLIKSFQKPTYVVDFSLIEKFWIKQYIYIYCTLMHIDAYCHSNLCFGIRGSVSTCFHRTSFAPGTILVQIWGLNVLSYHRSVLTHLGCEAKHKNNGRQGCNNVAIRSTNANTLQTLQSRRRYLHDRCFIRSKVQWTKMLVWPVF